MLKEMFKKSSVIFSFIVIAFSVWAYVETYSFTDRAARWPRTILFFTILFCLMLLISEAIRIFKKEKAVEDDSFSGLTWFVPALFGLALGYIYFVSRIGFFVTTFVFIIIGAYLLGYRKKSTILIASVTITILIYVIFKIILNLPLPRGIIF
jgi:hypothetical protein